MYEQIADEAQKEETVTLSAVVLLEINIYF